jgi:Cu-Zn family superoxide dismutase
MNIQQKLFTGSFFATCTIATADQIEITMNQLTTQGSGPLIGYITARSTDNGTEFIPDLNQLSPGLHGFHIHQHPNCGSAEKQGKIVPGLAAKGHFDPHATGSHAGPEAAGPLGDLPPLTANEAGKIDQPVIAPRVKLSDLKGRALIIHAGGDNFSDKPKKLGGGGARVACGVIN